MNYIGDNIDRINTYLFIYFISSTLFLRIIIFIPIKIISHIAGINFYILPILIGLIFYDLIMYILKISLFDDSFKILFSYFLGCVIISFLVVVFINSFFWNNEIFLTIVIVIICIWNIIKIYKNIEIISFNKITFHFRINLKNIIIYISLLIISYMYYIIEYRYLPFPILSSQNTELLYSLYISEGNSLPYSILTAAATANRLPTIILAGLISDLYNIHPIYLYHTVPILFSFIYVYSTYFLSKYVIKDIIHSVLSAFLVPIMYLMSFRMTSQNMVIYTFPIIILLINKLTDKLILNNRYFMEKIFILLLSLILPIIIMFSNWFIKGFIYPNYIILILFFISFIFILFIKNNKNRILFIIGYSLSIFITWNHIENSFFHISFIIIMLLSKIYFCNITKNKMIVYYMFLSICYIFIIIQILGIISFSTNFIFTQYIFGDTYNGYWFDIDANIKWYNLNNVYSTPLMIIFSLISLITIPLLKNLMPISIAFIWAIIIFFIPEGFFYRIYYHCFPIPTAILVSYLFTSLPIKLMSIFSKKMKDLNNKLTKKKYYVVLFIVIMVFGTILANTSLLPFKNKFDYIRNVRQNVNKEGHFSYISFKDVICTLFISSYTPKQWVNINYFTYKPIGCEYKELTWDGYIKYIPLTNDTLLISDPYTMVVLAAFSGRDIPLHQVGYSYISEYSEISISEIKFIKNNIFLENNSENAFKNIIKIRDNHKKVLIIVNGRTISWLESNEDFIYSNVGDFKYFKQKYPIFFDEKYFKQIYESDAFLIFRVDFLS